MGCGRNRAGLPSPEKTNGIRASEDLVAAASGLRLFERAKVL